MSYAVPANPLAVSFDLTESGYSVPVDALAIDFELQQFDGPVYPVPPGIMVSSFITGASAAVRIGDRAAQLYGAAGQRQIRSALSAGMAAVHTDGKSNQHWDATRKADGEHPPQRWGKAAPKEIRAASSMWDTVPRKDQADDGAAQPWEKPSVELSGRATSSFDKPDPHNVANESKHADSDRLWEPNDQSPYYRPQPWNGADFDLNEQYRPPGAMVVDFNLEPRLIVLDTPTRPVDSSHDYQGWKITNPADIRIKHPWDTKPRKGTEVDIDYGVEPNPDPVDPPDQPVYQKSYRFMNASSLKKLPEGTALEFDDLTISLDVDSFAWEFSARILNSASMDLIRPGASGPVEVEAVVNGHTWRFMVDQYTREQKFPKETWRATGPSVTQLLADPYSPKASRQVETQTNALQVAQSVLDLTGFTLEWDLALADYTIPAGVWGYENKTPVEVISELVKASGGLLQPDMEQSKLIAQHRYKKGAPWTWAALDESQLDAIIPDTLVTSLSSSWNPEVQANSVYVSGITDGVAVEVRRTGTAGDKPAADVYDHLNLSTSQCRGRGLTILGQTGNQEIVTVELPIPTSGAPGLVLPGYLVEYRDMREAANSWRALVLESTVKVSKPGGSRATQTLKLERHHY